MKYDIAVIGGGASGLACAVRLAERGKLKIAVIDACDRLGKKLAATGNGQGNVSNLDMAYEHYFGSLKSFAAKLCSNPYSGLGIFDCLFSADERGRIYPTGRQASALSDCLIRKIRGKADIYLSIKVTDISKGFELTLSDGTILEAQYVVFCIGGKAQKQFNTSGSSYALVEKFGHTTTKLYPSLVQIKTDTRYIKGLKGIRADCIASEIEGGREVKSFRGDVIFTEYGLSGSAIFSLSAYITDKQNTQISLKFLPDIPATKIISAIENRKKSGVHGGELLSGILHNKLGQAVIARSGEDTADIVRTVKNFVLPVYGTLGFDYAQVTRGGIPADEVSENLESEFVKNLYFAGEVLDIDGDCGGYNLQWAFTSGIFVAENILKNYD